MAKLTYSMMISLDGYINDTHGSFDWGQIDEEVHRHANAEARESSTLIYGRRMYETMVYWETAEKRPEISAANVERLKVESALDVSISGPTLAAPFLKQGLVDEIGIYYVPVVVGGGTAFFQDIQQPLKLERIEHCPFKHGLVFVRYHVLGQPNNAARAAELLAALQHTDLVTECQDLQPECRAGSPDRKQGGQERRNGRRQLAA